MAVRKVMGAAAVVAIVASSIVGGAIAASGDPSDQQFRRLQRQVNRLENTIDRLEGRIEALEEAPTEACLSTIPVAQFDDYLADDGFSSITGLDIDNVDPQWQVVIRTC